jgi:Ca2+-binding EF-hand superfamily protein
MKAISTLGAALILSFNGTVAAQQTSTPEDQATEGGMPTTEHQEQTAEEVTSDLFTRLDQDRNGEISQEEAQAESTLSQSWSKLDENVDGRLDSQEFSAFEQNTDMEGGETVGATGQTEEGMPTSPHQEEAVEEDLLAQLDQDGDGQISQQEAQVEAQLSDNWDLLDENRDGLLDSRELSQLEQTLSEIEEAE